MLGRGKFQMANRWLGAAVAFLCLSLVSTCFALAAGFDFDPDDYPGSYYAERIPYRRWVMFFSMLVPTLSAAAAAVSILVRPRSASRIVASAIVLVLVLPIVWFCWVIGIESIQRAVDFSLRYSG